MLNKGTFAIASLLLLLLGSSFTSCRKYEEGPTISFLSREARVANNWIATNISRNTIPESSVYEIYQMNFAPNGSMTWTEQRLGGEFIVRTAAWELARVDEEIKLTFDETDPVSGETRLLFMEIRKLKDKELWLSFFWQGDEWEIRFEAA